MPQGLQCPRCQGAVSVANDAAGKRVRCPHCQQPFLAPGLATTPNDDDDWLKLDSASPRSTDPVVQSPPSKPAAPKLSDAEGALLAEFADDLDQFTAQTQTPPVKPFPTAPGSPTKPVAGTGASSPIAAARPVEHAKEYRVNCSICGSTHFAKAAQAGKTIKCSDCHSPILVPPPPKVRSKAHINLDQAETFAFESNENTTRRRDPYKKSAEDLLAEASRVEKPRGKIKYDDVPDAKEWFHSVFGVFFDPGVLVHWIGLSVLAAIPTYIALTFDMDILKMGLFPLGLFLAVLVISCGFAILQSVANQNDRVGEWPLLDPFAWIGQMFVALAAAFVAGVPVWLICSFVLGTSLVSIALTMFSVYVLFPFVLLSMLDMDTPFAPFSPEVARSVTKCEDAWGGFYFPSSLLFVGLFLLFATVSTMAPGPGAVVAIIVTIGIAFVYFSMIGRLAYAIGQGINAPPMENDIDRSQKNDVM